MSWLAQKSCQAAKISSQEGVDFQIKILLQLGGTGWPPNLREERGLGKMYGLFAIK